MRKLAFVGSLCTLGLALPAGPAAAVEFMLEPEMGARAFTGDAADLVGAGAFVGGTLGIRLSPMMVLTGRLDFGLHRGGHESIDAAASFAISAGGRVYLVNDSKAAVQPFVLAEVGVASIGWDFGNVALYDPWGGYVQLLDPDPDALGSLTAGLGGGVLMMLSDNLGLSGSIKLVLHAWADETAEGLNATGFEGSQVAFHAGMVVALGN